MLSPRIQRFLRLQRLLTGLFGLLIGLIFAAITEWFVTSGLAFLPWLFILTALIGVIVLILYWRKPPGIEVAIQSPRTIRSAEESRRYARRGFIGFVPLYTPKPGAAAARLSAQERAQAVEAHNFEALQLEESNLRPTIEAILSHASRLEHCWLLATRGHDTPGSSPYAPLLAAYLRARGLGKCKFYYGQAYTIALDDDALVLSKTYDQLQRVLAQAARLGLAPRELVADFTTGFRSMTLGMVLACLSRDQDLEFVGARYNEQGQPEGDLFPIIFSFEPLLSET